ncbi:unnamed protein product [Paramecium octaurelia]|uniref:Transmembrane protein n=1 Tax=Paramecium octaurelia TaxID=43137 RepID=A0A8S1WRN9_PAROT|nr:unnamed protein product [Paramecium octaurelia]
MKQQIKNSVMKMKNVNGIIGQFQNVKTYAINQILKMNATFQQIVSGELVLPHVQSENAQKNCNRKNVVKLLLVLGGITNVGTHHVLHCKLKRLVNALIRIAIEMRNESFVMIKNAQTIIIKLIVIKYLFVVGINTNAQTMIMTRLIIKKVKNNVDLNHLITYDQSQPQIQNFLVVYKNSLILPVYFILFLFFLFKQQ